jgi:hypothetical protein
MEYSSLLIDLYAKHTVSAVKSQPAYQALKEQYEKDAEFQWLRNRLDTMKTRVEERIASDASQQEQLRQAINMLRGYRSPGRERERDLFCRLVVAISQDWHPDRRAYLEKAFSAVRLRYDYFLSFTTRHSPHSNLNPINTRYWHFIQKILHNRFELGNKDKENLFATAINAIFSDKAKGYFFPKSEDDTSIVAKELQGEINQSMVFVQIIQSQLFDYTENNYCFLEWGWAINGFNGDEKRFLYILGEADRDWLDILVPDETYRDWHSHVKAKKAPPTPLHRTLDDIEIEQTTRFFETLLKNDIVGAWTRLETAAP